MAAATSENGPDAYEPGSLIGGKYEILATLGSGGMGVVCAARHIITKQPVALKFVKDEGEDPELPRRLLREARAAAAVKHPNVVEIFDVLEDDNGTPVIVMEHLHGEPLRNVLQREGRLSPEAAARYLLPVSSAVGTAHELGIVHRDLKPDNIFISRNAADERVVKVLDFGIAKMTRLDGQTNQSLGLTGTGEILGTPSYMSPEQIFGECDIDQRADIWSLGVILYECLAGQVPTNGGNLGQVLKLIVAGGIKPLDLAAPATPPDMVALVGRMLARNREDRPLDLREVVQLLSRYSNVVAPSFNTAQIHAAPRSKPDGEHLNRFVLGLRIVGPDAEPIESSSDLGVDQLARTHVAHDTFHQLASVRSVPRLDRQQRRWLTTALALLLPSGALLGWQALAQPTSVERATPLAVAAAATEAAAAPGSRPAPTASSTAPAQAPAASSAPVPEPRLVVARAKRPRKGASSSEQPAPSAPDAGRAPPPLPIFERPPF